MNPALVREATALDARAIAEVHVASWRWAYRGEMAGEFLAALSVDERESRLLAQLDDPDVVVLVADATGPGIVGFATSGPSRDDDAGQQVGELYAIYLLPDVAGTGVGRKLLAASTARLRDGRCTRATAWVLETNQRARAFYERQGWAWDGSRSEHRFDCAELPIVRYASDLRTATDPVSGGRRSR